MNIKTIAAATMIAFGAIANSVSAAPISIGDFVSDGMSGINPGETFSFEYTAVEDMKVLDFVSITGNGLTTNITEARFGYAGDPVVDVYRGFTAAEITTVPGSATSTGQASLDGFILLAGQTFTVTVGHEAGSHNSVDVDFTFLTADVPLPAAGFMLLGGLGGLAMMRRRKEKAKA